MSLVLIKYSHQRLSEFFLPDTKKREAIGSPLHHLINVGLVDDQLLNRSASTAHFCYLYQIQAFTPLISIYIEF